MREETRYCHIGYSFQLAARVLLYASSSQRQDNTYHSLCYTSHGALAGTRNSSCRDDIQFEIDRLTALFFGFDSETLIRMIQVPTQIVSSTLIGC